jgi:hypothetical protein
MDKVRAARKQKEEDVQHRWLQLGPVLQRWKKYFSFCQLDVMRQKMSAKWRDFRQNLKDT